MSALEQMSREVLDLLVIGGGIVGAGVARDAAMRGLRVGLCEQFDFAFGTSSRSSRLLHGGLRYLAQGRIGLVREASVEKVIISNIAPHLAAPLPFIFPTKTRGEWKRWKLRLGVKTYDLLCSGRNLGRSSALSTDETLKLLPGLNKNLLSGAVRYYDGLTNDARLVLDTLRSAQANGAMLANYAKVEKPELRGEEWHCKVDGVEIKARTIVNATGAWANRFPPSSVKLRLTKGVHLVIDRGRLPVPDAVVMSEGSRILFAIPWGQRVILGTTDTDYLGSPDCPGVDPSDVRYILGVANGAFTDAHLTTQDVISAWSGVRPLISNGDQTGKPSDISRAHQIHMTQHGWFDVAGGKLTTYRLMAEQTIDDVVKLLGKPAAPCKTATTPLLPDEPQPEFSGILPPQVSKEAVEHFCKNEWAQHLADVMIRRTSWRYYHPDHLAIAQRALQWMSELLNWDPRRMQNELADYERLVNETRVAIADASEPRPSAA